MKFAALRLSGFKSFADPVELLVEPGMTGVVGPNGCGKSNLVEALRWVMGETSAKRMRGTEMDDVIDRVGESVDVSDALPGEGASRGGFDGAQGCSRDGTVCVGNDVHACSEDGGAGFGFPSGDAPPRVVEF
jgi:recombinational DNA repair ATPase RecF